jgi:DNA-binding transcriptional LysR family regulator
MRDELTLLAAFLTVAEERSFTRAEKQLNISTSGLSHTIRRLEEQIGVRLLTRTTRSVSPTDAGEQLLAHLRPALADIRGTLTTLSGLQTTPIGRVRLLCPRLAARTVVAPKLGKFARLSCWMTRISHWTPPFPGYFLYYPHRKQQPAVLAALIDTLRL